VGLNMDGNFNWEQMKQSETQQRNNVALHNGEGFVVESSRFARHSAALSIWVFLNMTHSSHRSLHAQTIRQ
jgi:hypothetical protein